VPYRRPAVSSRAGSQYRAALMSWPLFVSPPRAPQKHHRWFEAVAADVAADYGRLHAEARGDPQRSGHGGESTWVRLLADWLPPAYGVAARKYILPETDDEQPFETDIVVFNPGYPKRLRDREEILVGGVAAAFSVKLTLDAAGLRDGVERAARLRRGIAQRHGSVRQELGSSLVVGVLAHSHSWRRADSDVARHVATALSVLDRQFAQHPRECLDLLCVSDLATWSTRRLALGPGEGVRRPELSSDQAARGYCRTLMLYATPPPAPVGLLITDLLARLSHADPTLRPLAENLDLTGTQLAARTARDRFWHLEDVLSPVAQYHLGRRDPFVEGFEE
jgi:hypothetical protein